MWELDHKEGWALKNWCFWTVVLEKTLESPLNCKEIKLVNPKGNQSWIFTGRIDAEALILWPPDAKSQLIRKDSDAGKYRRQEEKGMTEDEMVGWHHRLNGQGFEQALGNGERQGKKAWHAAVHGISKSQTRLSDWTELNVIIVCLVLNSWKAHSVDCSHEIKRHLLLARKAMTNLESMLKIRDVTLTTKVRLVKVMVFSVVMDGCESWTIKQAECWRSDAFELWCWRNLLRVPWTARRSN